VQETISSLQLGPEDSGVVGLALKLAEAVDAMDEATRGRMLAQTSGPLVNVLNVLQERSRRRPAPSGFQPSGGWNRVG
jgi:hypothetical protein